MCSVCVQPSVPLQHLPLDVRMESLPPALQSRLGFAVQVRRAVWVQLSVLHFHCLVCYSERPDQGTS